MEVGFSSAEILEEVVANWSSEETEKVLKQIPGGPNGEGITELEVVALLRQFRACRLKLISKICIN